MNISFHRATITAGDGRGHQRTARRVVLAGAICLVVGVACSSAGGDDTDKALDIVLTQAADIDMTLDRGCAAKIVEQLPSGDVKAIIDGGVNGSPDLSARGREASTELFGCMDKDQLVDQLIEASGASNPATVACLKQALADFDVADLTSSMTGDEQPAAIGDEFAKCAGG